MTARNLRQPPAEMIPAAHRSIRVSAAIIAITIIYATWQLAFRPPVHRWDLLIELAVVVGLAWQNIAACRVARTLASVIMRTRAAIDAAADQPGDDGSSRAPGNGGTA